MDKILDIVNGWITAAVASEVLQIKQILLFILSARTIGSCYLENTRNYKFC